MRWKNSNNSQREDWLTFFQFDLVYFCASDQFSRGVFSREKTLPWERSAVVWQMNRQSKDWQPFSILTHLQTAASQYFRVHSSPPCYQRPGVGECIMLSKEIREIQIVADTTLTITSTTTSKPSLQSPLQSIVVVVVVFSVPWVWSGSPRSPHNMHTQVKKNTVVSASIWIPCGSYCHNMVPVVRVGKLLYSMPLYIPDWTTSVPTGKPTPKLSPLFCPLV